MALEHALLVALAEREGSGYELARRFDKSIGFFWRATHQQIYRVLKRMSDGGWVHGTAVTQDGRPDKIVYGVSQAGRDELARWIGEPTPASRLRDELAVKIRGAGYGDLDALRREVTRHRDEHAARLELFRLVEKRDFPSPASLSGAPLHQYLVLRGGIRAEVGLTEWCEEVLEALASQSVSSAPKEQ